MYKKYCSLVVLPDSRMRKIEPVRNLIVGDYVNMPNPGKIGGNAAQAVSAKCYTIAQQECIQQHSSSPQLILFSETIGADCVVAALS